MARKPGGTMEMQQETGFLGSAAGLQREVIGQMLSYQAS